MADDAKYVTATDATFQDIIQSDKPVLVDFWAPWCGPCLAIAPTIAQVAAEYDGRAVVAKVNTDENMVANQFGIRSIPTLLFFQNGVVVDQLVGAVPKKMLVDKLDALLAQTA